MRARIHSHRIRWHVIACRNHKLRPQADITSGHDQVGDPIRDSVEFGGILCPHQLEINHAAAGTLPGVRCADSEVSYMTSESASMKRPKVLF